MLHLGAFALIRGRTCSIVPGHDVEDAIDFSITNRCVLFVLLVAAGCVVETPDEPLAPRAQVLAVNVSPGTATVEWGDVQQFTATVNGTELVPQSVKWSVRPGTPSGPVGDVDSNGSYHLTKLLKRPIGGVVPPDGRDFVVATSLADTSKSGQAIVNIPALSIAIVPTTAELTLGDTLAFAVTVRGLASKAVEWHTTYFGTTDANGVYTAPGPPLSAFDEVIVRPAGWQESTEFHDSLAFATINLHLHPPVLTSASGPVRFMDTLTIFGSGFLPGVRGMTYQVLFEDTSGKFPGGLPPFGITEDRMNVEVPCCIQFSGRLQLSMWGAGDPYTFGLAYSNIIDAGLPP